MTSGGVLAPSRGARRGRALGAGLLALPLGACATLAPPSPVTLEKARAVRTYSASLRVTLRTPELRGRARVLLACARPDALRLEVPGPGGLRLLAVARAGRLVAVFPGRRAVFAAQAGADQMRALLGIPLEPGEVMDALLGLGSARLEQYEPRWGASLPREVRARLPGGGRLSIVVEQAEADPALPPAAFDDPPHAGYREVGAEEARQLWLGR